MSEPNRLPDNIPREAHPTLLPSSPPTKTSPTKTSPTESIAIPSRNSSLPPDRPTILAPPSTPQPPSIPERTSSKRSLSWNREFENKSTEELSLLLYQTNSSLSNQRKKLRRKVSMDGEYWDDYLEITKLYRTRASIMSHLDLRKVQSEGPSKKQTEAEKINLEFDISKQSEAEELELQFESWKQNESIVQKHLQRLKKRLFSTRESFFRLFATSRIGLHLPGSGGRRSSRDQAHFGAEMISAYCPNPPDANCDRWDPILLKWLPAHVCRAAHLFPWRQVTMMDEIFGDRASDEIFSPVNGLFLHYRIEEALEKGLIAIIPDIELDPADPNLPLEDQRKRRERVRAWEKQPIRDYKVIVVDPTDSRVQRFCDISGERIYKLVDLHERKLVFQTDFRPRARYVWWTFMNTILRNAWAQSSRDDSLQHQEVQKATRYWGTWGRYVKQNQLLGFVEELGQDVESILEHDIDGVEESEGDEEVEPEYDILSALVQETIAKSGDEDSDQEDDLDEDEESEDEDEENEDEDEESED